jgi:hypothetical protein
MIDTEKLFQQLAAKDWDGLSELLLNNKSVIHKDPYLGQVAKLFESEFLSHIESLAPVDKLGRMRHISLIIESDRTCFAKSFVEKVIDEKMLALMATSDDKLASYASTHFDRPLAKTLLLELRQQAPEQLAQARNASAKIEAATNRKASAKTLKLFKSRQEQSFFDALRDVFPNHIPYPNVAMSCVIDIDAIREAIPLEAREYFFKAVIDFVLYDPHAGHEPIHFFELDSKFHDGERARRNDALKNSILGAAGVKLVRIRAFSETDATTANFKKLIVDLIAES